MTKEIIFTISFKKGLADRNRLPIDHVIEVLRELKEAVREVGRRVQWERGMKQPDGDFGIELLADGAGFVFQKGSVSAPAVLTRDVENGKEAVRRVLHTLSALERRKPASLDDFGQPVVRRLASIIPYQKMNGSVLELTLQTPQNKKLETAKFGEAGIVTMEKLSRTESRESGITLYGRLRELRDRSKQDEGSDHFWGELIADSGILWKIQFDAKDTKTVVQLFRHRVAITGDAFYRTSGPKLLARVTGPDKDKDYEAAFDRLYGCDKDIYGKEDFDSLMAEMRGDT